MPSVWVIVILVVALVSLVLAFINGSIANSVYLMLLAIWLTLFVGAKSPW